MQQEALVRFQSLGLIVRLSKMVCAALGPYIRMQPRSQMKMMAIYAFQ